MKRHFRNVNRLFVLDQAITLLEHGRGRDTNTIRDHLDQKQLTPDGL